MARRRLTADDGAGDKPGAAKASRVRQVLRGLLAVLVALPLALLLGGQAGLFAGQRPAALGVRDGRLAPPPATPNCVSSQSTEGYSKIAPLAFRGDGRAALARLAGVVAAMPGARIVDARADYVYAEFRSRWLGFVDDVEFYLDGTAGVIQVRSASRLGYADFGVNRQRVEAIRLAFAEG